MIEDFEAAIELFQDNESGHLMQESELRKSDPFVCSGDDIVGKTQ